jgi:hypothetical protein
VNFYVGDFYKNVFIRFTFGEDQTTVARTLREDLRTFMLIFRHLQDKCKTCDTDREAKETIKDTRCVQKKTELCYKDLILQHFKHCPLQSSTLYWRYTVPNVSSIVGMLPGTHFL